MKILTEKALLVCDHKTGVVKLTERQDWVKIGDDKVLVKDDPENRSIAGCTFFNPALSLKSCTQTQKVDKGYSEFVRIDGNPVCLDTVTGYTNGASPKSIHYSVVTPGQDFVEGSA